MSAHRRHVDGWATTLIGAGLLATAVTWLVVVVFPQPSPTVRHTVPGIRELTDAEMRDVVGGWLEPKARRVGQGCALGGCSGGDEGGQVCEDCGLPDACESGYSTGDSPDGGAPCVDAATAEVRDQVDVMHAGPAGGGLCVGLTYASQLADSTNTIIDAGLGAGWTHSYNGFLWQRGASFYWFRSNTEIVRFTYRAGQYYASSGQFYTMTQTGSETAEVALRDGTIYQFRQRITAWQPPDAVIFALDGIVDPNGRATQLTYEPDGRLTQVNDPDDNVVDYEYTPDGRLQRVSAAGRETQFEYGPTGQVSAVDLPNGQRIEWEYNHRGQIVRKVVPRGTEYQFEYNPDGTVTGLNECDPDTGDCEPVVALTSTTDWEPDHETSLITGEMHYYPGTATVTDGRGNMWEYDYDARGRVVATRRSDGTGTGFEYDPDTLRPSRVVDANGNATEFEYDVRGNRTVVRDAEGNETQYEYESVHNRVVRRTEPDGDEWVYEYDANGNLVREIDPLHGPGGPSVDYEYDTQGRLIRQTDRNGNPTEWEYDARGNVSKVTDPIGVETTYEYDYFGNVLTRTLHADDPGTPENEDQTATFTCDARDRVLTETDSLGVTTCYEYDADGNRTAVFSDWVDETNYRCATRHEYDERGRLVCAIEDEGSGCLNRTTEYEYDANGNLARQVNPNGIATEHEYDSLDRLIRTVLDPSVPADPSDPNSEPYDGLDIEWQSEHDAFGNRTSETDPNGSTTTYQYDVLNRLRLVTDPLGGVTEYRYFLPGGGCCGTPGSSLIKCVIDTEGKVTQYRYDKLGRRTQETRQVGVQDCDRDPLPEDVATLFEYDANGNVLSITDANGNTTSSTHTPRDEVATTANGCGETITYTYDAAGNRIREQWPNGNVAHSDYDLNNRLVRVHDALGDLVTYTYDAVGNLLTQADAVGPPTMYESDLLGRQIAMTDPMGESMHNEYDPLGNLIRVVDREGNQTVYEYDAADRQTAMRYWPDAGGSPSVITRAYDGAGNLLSIVDANGNATLYEYDALHRVIRETYADQTERGFAHDAVGNLLTRDDSMGEDDQPGNVTQYVYDDLHRQIRTEYATGEVNVFTVDPGGRLLTADNNHSHLAFTYDCADRILTSTQTDLPQTYSYTTSYAYDVYARTRAITYPSGKVVVETRDLRDRLHTVTADGADVATYAYDLAGRVLTKAFGNGTEARYVYNDNDWVTSLRHVAPDGVTTFAGFAHHYDREGNRLNAINLQEVIPYDPAKPVTHSEKYTYDDMYRLVNYQRGEWVAGDIPAPRRHRTWQLDPVHNWTSFGIHDLDTGEDAEYCDAINEMNEYDDPSTDGPCPVPDDDGLADDFMVSPCPPVPTPDSIAVAARHFAKGMERLTAGPRKAAPTGRDRPRSTGYNRRHDKNGNLLDDGTREFYYDYQTDPNSCLRGENRLTMVKDKATGNVLGEYWYDALGRRIRKLADGVSTIYVVTPEWHGVQEYDNGSLARTYVIGDTVDERLCMDPAATARLYYHQDAQQHVTRLSDEAGAPVECYAYDAYGNPHIADASGDAKVESACGNPFLFTGRRYDTETGCYDYRTRVLDPDAGRFTTRDLLGDWGDLGNVGNTYAYVANRPTSASDPSGRITYFYAPKNRLFIGAKIPKGWKPGMKINGEQWREFARLNPERFAKPRKAMIDDICKHLDFTMTVDFAPKRTLEWITGLKGVGNLEKAVAIRETWEKTIGHELGFDKKGSVNCHELIRVKFLELTESVKNPAHRRDFAQPVYLHRYKLKRLHLSRRVAQSADPAVWITITSPGGTKREYQPVATTGPLNLTTFGALGYTFAPLEKGRYTVSSRVVYYDPGVGRHVAAACPIKPATFEIEK